MSSLVSHYIIWQFNGKVTCATQNIYDLSTGTITANTTVSGEIVSKLLNNVPEFTTMAFFSIEPTLYNITMSLSANWNQFFNDSVEHKITEQIRLHYPTGVVGLLLTFRTMKHKRWPRITNPEGMCWPRLFNRWKRINGCMRWFQTYVRTVSTSLLSTI